MKAKLVYIDLLVRVVVPDDATDEDIMIAASDKAYDEARTDGSWTWFNENISDIKDDTECPAEEYDSSEDYSGDRMLEQQELSDFAQDDYDHNPEPENFL